MRRISLAVIPLALAVVVLVTAPASHLFAQSQDRTIASARMLIEQGSHDAAIALLRDALASRRADTALRHALVEALESKRASLAEQARALGDEIAALRAVPQSCDGRAPVRVGETIKAPMKTRDMKPAYPAEAMRQKVDGTVILEIVVDCTGAVSDARVLRGVPMLNDVARDAVRQWRYRPTLLNGAPVPVIMTVSVRFTVRD